MQPTIKSTLVQLRALAAGTAVIGEMVERHDGELASLAGRVAAIEKSGKVTPIRANVKIDAPTPTPAPRKRTVKETVVTGDQWRFLPGRTPRETAREWQARLVAGGLRADVAEAAVACQRACKVGGTILADTLALAALASTAQGRAQSAGGKPVRTETTRIRTSGRGEDARQAASIAVLTAPAESDSDRSRNRLRARLAKLCGEQKLRIGNCPHYMAVHAWQAKFDGLPWAERVRKAASEYR